MDDCRLSIGSSCYFFILGIFMLANLDSRFTCYWGENGCSLFLSEVNFVRISGLPEVAVDLLLSDFLSSGTGVFFSFSDFSGFD